MKWKELLVSEQFLGADRLDFSKPVNADDIAAAETATGHKFSDELRALYLETNGVYAHWDDAYCFNCIYPINELIEANVANRECDYYMPLDAFLFFGGLGNGDLIGYGRSRDGQYHHGIFLWEHETDARIPIGHNLRDVVRSLWKDSE